MLRLRSNCSVTLVWPSVLCAVISATPEIRPNSRSSGVATDEAMISGLAPGSDAWTEMVGKSTWGSGETGRNGKATTPASATAAVSSVVAIGRLMKGDERLIARWPAAARTAPKRAPLLRAPHGGHPGGRLVEEQVDDRGRVEGQELAEDQPADDRDPERPAQLRADALAEGERHGPEHGRHRRHQDRAEAQQAGLVDGVEGRLVLLALGGERKVDHHDGVLLHDADKKDDADDRHDRELAAADQQGQDGAHAGRRQRRQDRDRVDVALVEDPEDDVDRHERRSGSGATRSSASRRRPGRFPGRSPASPAGCGSSFSRPWIALTAAPREALGLRLKETVVAGNWPMWLMRMGAVTCEVCVTALSGTLPPAGGHEVDVLQAVRVGLELRRHLQDHVVLVELGEDRRHLPLPEAVVEAVVDVLRRDAQAGGGLPVEGRDACRPVGLQVARHVRQLGERLQAVRRTSRRTRTARPRSDPAGCTGTRSG